MKTVSKKLLSLLLVAMLLVSAVPFHALAEEAGYEVRIVVMVNEANRETFTFEASSRTEMLSWMSFTHEDIVEALQEEGELDYFDSTTDSASLVWDTPSSDSTTTLIGNLWLTISSSNTPSDGGGNIVPDVILKTDYCGNIPAKAGQKYLDVLPTPEKEGQEFAYWYSENLGGIVKADDIIEASDELTAFWQSPTKYYLTLDPNRGVTEDVNFGVQIAYGESLYAKVMKYIPEREGYTFVGWKLNGKIITANSVYELQGDATAYAEWKLESDTENEPMGGTTHEKTGKVYLEIYINGDTGTLEKRVDITSYAEDDKITRTEAQTVVKKYVTAKTGYTLSYDGLFDEDGWWWYTRDPETDGKEAIIVNRDGDDYVYVMVYNVKVVAADPTNPKTGDMVLPAAMTMMVVTGLAAAAVYVVGKKRRV